MATPRCKRVYAIYGRFNNRPAGFIDMVLTLDEVYAIQRRSPVSVRVKRECISPLIYAKMQKGMSYRQAKWSEE